MSNVAHFVIYPIEMLFREFSFEVETAKLLGIFDESVNVFKRWIIKRIP